nr:hypothetical protein [Prevotella intermedia]
MALSTSTNSVNTPAIRLPRLLRQQNRKRHIRCGTPQAIQPAQSIGNGSTALLTNRTNRVPFGAALLHVDGSLLARNSLLQPQQSNIAGAFRQVITLHRRSCPCSATPI